MGIFSKEKECPNCGSIVSKKDIVYYNVSEGKHYYNLKYDKICRKCAMEKLYIALLNHKEPLAVVCPINSQTYNAYVAYPFYELLEAQTNRVNRESTEELINGFKSILPQKGTKCNRCDKEALNAFCEEDAMYDNPYDWCFNENVKYEHLCPECTVKAFKEMLENEGLIIKNGIVSPGKGEEFMCSWQI